MKILVITPPRSSSLSGNATTARRWARILRRLGHQVRVAAKYDRGQADIMVALHAWRTAAAIWRFRRYWPDRPIIVALSGTDIYEYLARDPQPVLRSLECADRLVGLQDRVHRQLPARFRRKLRIIHQSAPSVPRHNRGPAPHFEVVVIGHLRDVKDPLRAAKAARLLPASSRLRIVHVGAADAPRWAAAARAEMAANSRYIWRGEVSRAKVRELLGRAQAIVLSSLSEGGANVISEALMAGVPVLASRIDGSVGLLGADYPGYFPVRDTAALARLLERMERDPAFVKRLRRAAARRRPLFRPEREIAAWRRLVRELR
jgi:putative glycosyltransferase (TIGR04348 family)